ncbi:MAG: glycosyltransferase family 4 protein [Gemmatimonas sp.]
MLNVAYPLAPVGVDAVGGAEQILSALDGALVAGGHRSIVIACAGSKVAGTLVPVPSVDGPLDPDRVEAARARHLRVITSVIAEREVDVVHLHGVDFQAYLPPAGPPVLATLHLPSSWYASSAVQTNRPNTWLQCVSQAQHEICGDNPRLLPPIENGVPVAAFAGRHAKRRFALMLARICPEKGIHIAIEAAKRAGVPLIIAGALFPYPEHRRYFMEEVLPRLDRGRRFIGPVGFARKRRLLGAARCLLVPSLVPETSSLAAREALAAGTPVVAFARGALRSTIDDGQTGFLVHDEMEMARALGRCGTISPELCRDTARRRFSVDRMTAQYLAVYRRLAAEAHQRGDTEDDRESVGVA